MGTISRSKASWGLTASGAFTGTNIGGPATIGDSGSSNFADADIAYSFKVTSTGATDKATLDLSAGTVAQTVGTPTITDGDGNDFEGITLPTLVGLHGFLVEAGTASGPIIVGSGSIQSSVIKADGDIVLYAFPTADTIFPDYLIEFSAIGSDVTVTVIGKSS